MVKDPENRRMSEALLNLHLRKAEEETLRNPEVREMVERLRKMYLEDQEGIFQAFAVTTEERSGVHPPRATPPDSKIPHLLMVLSELAERAPGKEVAARPSIPQSLLAARAAPPRPVTPVPEDDRQRELMREIEEAKKKLALVKKEETLIKARRGKYGIPGERLKAERLLRELPAQITQMEHTLQLLREGVL